MTDFIVRTQAKTMVFTRQPADSDDNGVEYG